MEQQRAALHLRRLLIALALLAASAAPATAATPWCLPPVFEGGQRVHTSPSPRVTWLPLALRQHRLCWHAAWRPEELRVIVLGSSAVYGLGVSASETFSALLSADLAAQGIDASVFNLAWVNPYQLRDALVLREAMAFRPDVIIYPVTKAEFIHVAPTLWKPLNAFFINNRAILREMVADPPRGLSGPLERYAQSLDRWDQVAPLLARLREIGSFARAAAGEVGRVLPAWLGGHAAVPGNKRRSVPDYDCDEIMAQHKISFANWQDWNILEELEALHQATGVEVLMVNWPLGANPSGLCFNARFTYQDMIEFGDWMADQTSRRGLGYVDLTGRLDGVDFIDTVHVHATGHRKIADYLRYPLEQILARVQKRRHSDS